MQEAFSAKGVRVKYQEANLGDQTILKVGLVTFKLSKMREMVVSTK